MNDRLLDDDTRNNSLLDTLLAAQRRHRLFPAPSSQATTTVIVGVSGGADSVALLHLLTQLRQPLHLDLHVAHLDHALRPESAQDRGFVAQLATAWGLPFHCQCLTPGLLTQQAGGVEDAGRRARYTFFAQVAINVTPLDQVPCVALAHHADDQAETVLLHLLRGSGLRGLGGMRWVQELALNQLTDEPKLAKVVLRVVRPLLQVRKAELIDYLHTQQIVWREDGSNQNPDLVRNRVRHEVLPLLATLNPGIVATLGRTAATLAAENERAEQLDQQVFTALRVAAPADRVVLDLAGLQRQDQATQRGVLRQALMHLTPHLTNRTFEQVERVLMGIEQPLRTHGPHPLYQDVAWSVAGPTPTRAALLSLHHTAVLPFPPDHPYLEENEQGKYWPLRPAEPLYLATGWELHLTTLAPEQLPSDWRQPDHPWRVYVDADQLGAAVLTTPRPGLRIAPLGMGGRHKQLGDFFTDHKISPSLRPGWPLVVDKKTDEVRWVCGLTIAHSVRITEQTERVIELAFCKADVL